MCISVGVCWRVCVYECGSLLILCFYLWGPMSGWVLVAGMGVCPKCECVSFCVSLNVSMGDCVVVSAFYSFYKDIVRKMPFLKEFYRRYLSLCFKRPSYQSHLPANILEKNPTTNGRNNQFKPTVSTYFISLHNSIFYFVLGSQHESLVKSTLKTGDGNSKPGLKRPAENGVS